jgi:hypothetical protein
MSEAAAKQGAGTLRRYQKPDFRKSLSLMSVTAGNPPPVGSPPLMPA